jgi:tRNA threonylcarbamoyladenosine biosynthesis protein TsaE
VNVEVKPVGPEESATVHAVVHAAFEARPPLDPPAAALSETRDELEERLARHGGLLARVDGVPAGALVLDPVGSTMYLRRVGVVPDMRHHHVAAALIDAATRFAVRAPASSSRPTDFSSPTATSWPAPPPCARP